MAIPTSPSGQVLACRARPAELVKKQTISRQGANTRRSAKMNHFVCLATLCALASLREWFFPWPIVPDLFVPGLEVIVIVLWAGD